jgi:hypothetical protein
MMFSLTSPPKSIGAFFVRCMLWFPICLAFWVIFAPVLHFPIALVMHALSWFGVPSWLLEVQQHPQTFTFVTSLRPPTSETGFNQTARVTTEVNALLYTFGLPLFAALTLASAQPKPTRALWLGYLVLLPFFIAGVYATGLKQISVGASAEVAKQLEFSTLQNTVIAYVYQFSTLIMPPVTAIAAWFFTHREFIERFARGVFPTAKNVSRTSA